MRDHLWNNKLIEKVGLDMGGIDIRLFDFDGIINIYYLRFLLIWDLWIRDSQWIFFGDYNNKGDLKEVWEAELRELVGVLNRIKMFLMWWQYYLKS